MVRARRVLAVIPARGGSKRIPQKNIIDFLGKPMLAWTVEAALQSGCFDRVLVSTDDQSIAEVARQAGAEVPFLRAAASDDHAHVSAATLLALEQAEEYWQVTYDLVVQLMPNCPLRDAKAINKAVDSFIRGDRDFQISCFAYGWSNPWWANTLLVDGSPRPKFPEAGQARSQDLPELYCPTGAIWIARVPAFRSAGTFYGPGYKFEPMPIWAAADIDEPDDLILARVLAAGRAAIGTI